MHNICKTITKWLLISKQRLLDHSQQCNRYSIITEMCFSLKYHLTKFITVQHILLNPKKMCLPNINAEDKYHFTFYTYLNYTYIAFYDCSSLCYLLNCTDEPTSSKINKELNSYKIVSIQILKAQRNGDGGAMWGDSSHHPNNTESKTFVNRL